MHVTKEACTHLKYLIKVFDQLGTPSIASKVDINNSQSRLSIYEDNSACIFWSESEIDSTEKKIF